MISLVRQLFLRLRLQQHMQQQWVHVPEPTVYTQALCVWPWQRLQRRLRRVPGVRWVEPWPVIWNTLPPPECVGFFLGGFFWSSMYRLSLQSIRRVDRTSSAVRTDAVSLKIHGSVMETSTVMTTQMKLQKIPGALAQVRHTESLQEYFIYSVHVFSIFIELVWLQDM